MLVRVNPVREQVAQKSFESLSLDDLLFVRVPARGASPRKDFQMMFSSVMSGSTGRDHCGLPCGVFRYMWAWISVTLPT